MCEHVGKKIIGVYTMHCDWNTSKMAISIDAQVAILSDNAMTGCQENIFCWGW